MKKFLVVLALASIAFVGCTRTEKHIATGAAVGAGLGAGAGAIAAERNK